MIKLKSLLDELEYPLAKGKNVQAYAGNEGWKGKIIWMSPDKFLRMVHPLPDYEKDDESSKDLERKIKAGHPIDFLVLVVDVDRKKVVGHEGRHRATVAKKLGVEKVPVLVYTGSGFKRVPQWSPEDHAMIDKLEFKPEWQSDI